MSFDNTALKGEGSGVLPPLLMQYVELCNAYPDYLLLFQVGDFYECFGEEAERLAVTVDLVLTRKTSKDFVTPMAGIPLKSLDSYVEMLLNQGVKVAIAEQVSQPGDGLVKREVTQLITPGTVTDDRLLQPDANYLAALATGDGYGLAFLDVTTGEFRAARIYALPQVYDELRRYYPAEVLLAPELYNQEQFRADFTKRFSVMVSSGRFDCDQAKQLLTQHLKDKPARLEQGTAIARAAGAVLSYALDTQKGSAANFSHVNKLHIYDPNAYMQLNDVALSTLEIFQAQTKASKLAPDRSLFGVLDDTRTAPGRRLLKAWLRHPLLEPSQINHRLDAVETFVTDRVLCQAIRSDLYKMHDLTRIASRMASTRVSARDLIALSRSLSYIPHIRSLLEECIEKSQEKSNVQDKVNSHNVNVLTSLTGRLSDLKTIRETITTALVDDPPLKITEGGLIKDGFDARLDELRHAGAQAQTFMLELEAKERQRSKIPTLKIGFNGVFGYYFEVTKPYYDEVPKDFKPIQTLKDRQRYVRADLREKEREILRNQQAAHAREYVVFDQLRQDLIAQAASVRDVSETLAELDVYTALANVATQRHYCRPNFADELEITAGRHPVVEHFHEFIANDATMGLETDRLLILTGPNMSGKSTFLRQNALISILAQIGSYVPAEQAILPIFTQVFTRIGAADDIASGRSTFMVEMNELADILQQADSKSLVVLDEIGRGTSTFDGLALAWAAAEYLHDTARAYTLLATHYFELTHLAKRLPHVANYHVAAKEEAKGLMFYHQVLAGAASKSYGIQVAKLAGVPVEVVARASHLLTTFQANQEGSQQDILESILAQDITKLTPLDALMFLKELQDKLEQTPNQTQ